MDWLYIQEKINEEKYENLFINKKIKFQYEILKIQIYLTF